MTVRAPRAGRAELDAKVFARALIRWQRHSGRHDLPWQRTRDPYRVWLSEVMLQQTQVSTVLGYFERFVERFPDVHALARAPLDDVLALWSGLGYYSRARHLHRCAQVVVHEHGARFPSRSADLARLPGIGRSTAAAIAAFCFGERVAILDGNVKRVLARVLAFEDDLRQPAAERKLWAIADSLVPPKEVGAYTQGLMDLGAQCCKPKEPRCTSCPVRASCAAFAEGRPTAYPVRSVPPRRGQRRHHLLWLQWADQVWLVQRPARGVWAGLWSLPEFGEVAALQRITALGPGSAVPLPPIDHALTHFDWRLEPWQWALPRRLARARREAIEAVLGPGRWVPREALPRLALPAPMRRLLDTR